MNPHRLLALLAAAWLGALMAIALLAAPSAFKVLDRSAAAALVARLFALEAPMSLMLALGVLLLRRWQARLAAVPLTMDRMLILALVALFCTVAGYYGLQPMMQDARSGASTWTFAQLHTASLALFGLKVVAVAIMAWTALAAAAR